jgi:hypothetical protein
MNGRGFLEVARSDAAGPGEAFWRAAAVNAFYALILECRDALLRWGVTSFPRQNVHAVVRLKLTYASALDVKQLGLALDDLVQLRNHASYNLRALPAFSSPVRAQEAIQDATDALALLDAIENDSARRAAAIASLPP